MDDEVMTIPEVALFLKVSERWVRRDSRDYGLPRFKVGDSVRFLRADVRKWFEQQRVY